MKPSEMAPNTAKVIEKILTQSLDSRFYKTLMGGPKTGQKLTS
jgi:hypothetical protein